MAILPEDIVSQVTLIASAICARAEDGRAKWLHIEIGHGARASWLPSY